MTLLDAGAPALAWLGRPSHHAWLDAHSRELLAFGRRSGVRTGGAAYLDDYGAPLPSHGVQTWITARTVHTYALGTLLGAPGARPVAEVALAGLTGVLRDPVHGGWFHAVSSSGVPDTESGKSCYDHAFVMLAAASATLARLPGAADLLTEATGTFLNRFWDDAAGLPVDTWDVTFREADAYRGVNSTMHSVEAMLTVADAVAGDEATVWRERALSAVRFVVAQAGAHDWRLPEHYDEAWTPDLDVGRDRPDDKFKPYGATPGHGLEWSRLILATEAATQPDCGLAAASIALFDRAVADGWAADGETGFVYTTDWDGTPVVRNRMHWVVAEAINAAAALYARTGDARFDAWYATWWDYAERNLLDHDRGSWHHELDLANRPARTVWPGKPDLYHAFQATLIPRLPLAPTLPRALRDGLLQ